MRCRLLPYGGSCAPVAVVGDLGGQFVRPVVDDDPPLDVDAYAAVPGDRGQPVDVGQSRHESSLRFGLAERAEHPPQPGLRALAATAVAMTVVNHRDV